MADVYTGEVNVVASLSGKEDSKVLYLNNYCKCPSTLTATIDPSSLEIGEQAKITVYLENGGVPIAGLVYMTEAARKGTLLWGSKETGVIDIIDEKAEAFNAISGITQCTANSVIDEVVGVYTYTEDEDGAITHTSANLYDSFLNRTIDLTTFVATGTNLVITYKRAGSVENYFTAVTAGEAQIVVSTPVNTEEGLSQIVTVTINSGTADEPVVDPGGGGGSYTLAWIGPSSASTRGASAGGGINVGPWYASVAPIPSGDGVTYSLSNSIVVTKCSGWVQIVNGTSIRINLMVQTITIRLTSILIIRTNMAITSQQQQSWDIDINITA